MENNHYTLVRDAYVRSSANARMSHAFDVPDTYVVTDGTSRIAVDSKLVWVIFVLVDGSWNVSSRGGADTVVEAIEGWLAR